MGAGSRRGIGGSMALVAEDLSDDSESDENDDLLYEEMDMEGFKR